VFAVLFFFFKYYYLCCSTTSCLSLGCNILSYTKSRIVFSGYYTNYYSHSITKLIVFSFKRTQHPHGLSPSYECVTHQINTRLRSVDLKITVYLVWNLTVRTKNIICAVRTSVFYDHSIFKRIMNIFNLPTPYVRRIIMYLRIIC